MCSYYHIRIAANCQTPLSFVYGGVNRDISKIYGDVYALSLPGFVWSKVSDDVPELRRANHVCVGAGRSHLISLGGLAYDGDTRRDWWMSKDPFPRSIGIFDMNALKWKGTYTADDGGGYKTNETIASWYKNGYVVFTINARRRMYPCNEEKKDSLLTERLNSALDNVPWSSEKVAALFTGVANNDDTQRSDEPQDSNQGDRDSSPSSPSTSTGAIVGGVVAGLAALNALVGLAWFLYRRRQRAHAKTASEVQDESGMKQLSISPSPPPPSSDAAELHDHYPSKVLPLPPQAEVTNSELEDTGVAELADTERWKRTSATARRHGNIPSTWI